MHGDLLEPKMEAGDESWCMDIRARDECTRIMRQTSAAVRSADPSSLDVVLREASIAVETVRVGTAGTAP